MPVFLFAQQPTEDELQVNMNSYFDNFRLIVIYPSISITKNLDSKTSVNASYLVDAISSATMQMLFRVDGVTSATKTTTGGGDNTPDELRHQLNLGLTRDVFGATVSVDGMYSTEHDYSSKTFAANLIMPFAKKNTIFQIGYAGNWDKVFPQTRTWTKDRNTTTINLGVTQILSKKIISQLDFSYINVNGYMLDGYQVVRILDGSTLRTLEPIEPDVRVRKAAGLRMNFGVTKLSTLLLGYRYYWDTWDIKSHTFDIEYKTHVSNYTNISLGFRQYFQTKAYFFKPEYAAPEELMTVDGKLNSGNTNQLSLDLEVKGNKSLDLPFLNNEKVSLISSIGFYHRHTDSPDWATRLSEMYAYLFSIGFKILL
ncbi:MAG: DUF3570 domain-containing protein [Bacteroidetes bacterium]|nr:DUF3570 domain-containing protein [Bacteroidota bacterium]